MKQIFNIIHYIYSASWQKLRVVSKWNSTLTTSKTTDYVGNKIYENGVLKRILIDGGYIEASKYHYYQTDHLGNNRVVADNTGAIVQSTHYYPFGMAFAEGTGESKQPYKYNGKELDAQHGLNTYDYSARYMDPGIGRFSSVDPLAEKYYSISPYAYVANNPLKFTDPTGMYIDTSNMSQEEKDRYNQQVIQYIKNSDLFKYMYTYLSDSKHKFSIQFGATTTDEYGDTGGGQFMPNKDGGGVITYSPTSGEIPALPFMEEMFHAFQIDNSANYAKGEFNFEFEAKVMNTAISTELGYGAPSFGEIGNFQTKIQVGDYGDGLQPISPTAVKSESFTKDYMSASKQFVNYYNKHNIGNLYYRMNTTVAPYSLQKVVSNAYKK